MNSTIQKIKAFIISPRFVLSLYILLPVVITLRQFLLMHNLKTSDFALINNYVLFKNAFLHLIHYKDLYIFYNDIQFDLFKYSPSFAVFMAPFAFLPNWLGVLCWQTINSIPLFFAVKSLKFKDRQTYAIVALFMLQELITSAMNCQSNAILAALIILGYSYVKKEKTAVGTLFWIIAIFIKPFALAIYLFFLVFNSKIRIIIYSTLWAILIFLLPLLFVSVSQYSFLLQSWLKLLSEDHSSSLGFSVMGTIGAFATIETWKLKIVAIGVLIQIIPVIRYKLYNNLRFQLHLLSSLLIWMVIFNHKAESPTFIIAVAGVGIWFFSSSKHSIWDHFLLWSTLIFTQFGLTDLFPSNLRNEVFVPYSVKALPCILCWFTIIYRMCFSNFDIEDSENEPAPQL